MRFGPRARMRLWLGAMAGAGVALTHFLAFLVTSPDPDARADLLHATGHRYWPYFAALALGALVAGLVGFVADRVRGEAHHAVGERWASTALRMAVLQGLGFLYLEAGERLAVSGTFEGLLEGPVVLVGLLVQVVVAVVSATLLVIFARVVDRLYARLRRAPRPPKVTPAQGGLHLPGPRLSMVTSGRSLRGPPA